MKNKKKTQIGLYRIINNKVAYSVVVLATVISLIIINVSLWSLYVQMERLTVIEPEISSGSGTNSLDDKSKEKLTVKITLTDQQTRIFDGITKKPKSISLLEALHEISDSRGTELLYESQEGKTFIKKINNIEIGKNDILRYYINGNEVNKDITQINVGVGDTVEIKTL